MWIKSLIKKILCIILASTLCVGFFVSDNLMAFAKREEPAITSQELKSSQTKQESKLQSTSAKSTEQSANTEEADIVDWLKLDECALSEEEFLELLAAFRTAVIQIVNDYHDNRAQQWQDLRFEVGRLTQTTTHLDAEGFLPEVYFESHDQQELAIPGCFQLLNRKWLHSISPQPLRRLMARSIPNGLSISSVVSKVQVPIFGHYMSNGSWRLSNGCQAFCADYLRAMPTSGVQAIDVTPSQNEQLRRVLYYGYGGPANILGSLGFNEAQQIVITDDLVSQAYSQKCIANNELGGVIWSNGMFNVWKTVVEKPSPPSAFKVYIATFAGQGLNHKGQQVPYQPLAYGTMTNPDKGALQLIKAASDEKFELASTTNYSLAGAVYKIVKGNQPEGAKEIARLTIGQDHASSVLEVEPGIYWAKEIEAPKGYALDPSWHRIEVDANSSVQGPCRIMVEDRPQYIPIDLLLKKHNAFTHDIDSRLKGTRFRLRFYDIDPKEPDRYKNTKPLFERDDLICDEYGEVKINGSIFPIGVLTIEEIAVPEGFVLDDRVHVIALDPKQSTSEVLDIFQVPTFYNRPEKIILNKQDFVSGQALANVEFQLTSPSGKQTKLVCDENGQVNLSFDELGKWKLEETKAPPHYQLNPTPIVIEVKADGIDVLDDEHSPLFDYEAGMLTVKNTQQSFAIKLYKYDDQLQPLAGAQFSLYSDPGMTECVAKAVTDENGQVVFAGLNLTQYVLAETKAPEGYILPTSASGKVKKYTIRCQGGSEGYSFWVNMREVQNQKPQEIKNGTFYNASANGQYVLEGQFVNHIKATLPQTGSRGMGIILTLSLGCIFLAVAIELRANQRVEKKNRKEGK